MGETNDTFDLSLLDEVFAKYEGKKGALIPDPAAAQAIYGYLPVEVLQCIADRLDISLGKVYGVATFYAQFYLEKKGRHTLRVCDGTACHVKGAPALMSAVKQEFGVEPGETIAGRRIDRGDRLLPGFLRAGARSRPRRAGDGPSAPGRAGAAAETIDGRGAGRLTWRARGQ